MDILGRTEDAVAYLIRVSFVVVTTQVAVTLAVTHATTQVVGKALQLVM
jgi:hypothetical protein